MATNTTHGSGSRVDKLSYRGTHKPLPYATNFSRIAQRPVARDVVVTPLALNQINTRTYTNKQQRRDKTSSDSDPTCTLFTYPHK